jgi:hypothetical protein
VRLIAATNRDLAMMVDEEQLRADHFYRLKVFPVFAPPLRDRVSDIPVIVRHFVAIHSRRMGKVIKTIPETAMAAPTRWTWPGNIRELENFLERAVILSPGSVLYIPRAELAIKDENQGAEENISTLATAERDLILQTMRQTKGPHFWRKWRSRRAGRQTDHIEFQVEEVRYLRKDYMWSDRRHIVIFASSCSPSKRSFIGTLLLTPFPMSVEATPFSSLRGRPSSCLIECVSEGTHLMLGMQTRYRALVEDARETDESMEAFTYRMATEIEASIRTTGLKNRITL